VARDPSIWRWRLCECRGVHDPERVADDAAGALANVYGCECFFNDIVELSVGEVGDSAVAGDDE
jgi:hypothetical protein